LPPWSGLCRDALAAQHKWQDTRDRGFYDAVRLEARKIGRQVTGRSTAKVTAQHTLIYRYLIDRFGVSHAQLYADANRSGVEVDKLSIDCDFEPKDAYVYAGNSSRREELEAEAEAARSLGFNADVLPKAPLAV
jgi:glycine/D-amino acid oxidase-like deaminating enzyme